MRWLSMLFRNVLIRQRTDMIRGSVSSGGNSYMSLFIGAPILVFALFLLIMAIAK
jgi:hypothetical protein